MNRADKVALGYITVVGITFLTAAGITINRQAKEIIRQKKRVKKLDEALKVLTYVAAEKGVTKNDLIEHIVKYTKIPSDISNL